MYTKNQNPPILARCNTKIKREVYIEKQLGSRKHPQNSGALYILSYSNIVQNLIEIYTHKERLKDDKAKLRDQIREMEYMCGCT